jgi:arsenate reductase-like glutaredoxin family protein
MNIQIFGKKKCFETQKAERYFKERKIKFQAIDIVKFGMSKGEFENVRKAVGQDNLVDKGSDLYYEKNLDKIHGAGLVQEILLDNPKLIKTPIVRNGKQATVGYCPDVWKNWE